MGSRCLQCAQAAAGTERNPDGENKGCVLLRDPFVLHMACHAQRSGKASEEVIYKAYLETWTKKEMASGGVAVAVSDVSLEDVVRAGELVACRMLETNEWQGTVGVCVRLCGIFRCLPFRIEDFGEERSAFRSGTNCLGSTLQHVGLHVGSPVQIQLVTSSLIPHHIL